MKEILNFDFSELLLIILIPLGIFLFFVLRMIKLNFKKKQFYKNNRNYILLFEITIWLIFGVWALRLVFDDSIYFPFIVYTIFTIISIWIAWFLAKDFIAGIILKFSDNYQDGQFFKLNDLQGHIAQINYLHLNLNQDNGEMIKIPYSKILGSIHHKSFLDEKTKQHKFELSIEKKEPLDSIREKIRQIILLSPGVNINKEPIISLKGNSISSWSFEISYFILDEQYCELLEGNVKSSFE